MKDFMRGGRCIHCGEVIGEGEIFHACPETRHGMGVVVSVQDSERRPDMDTANTSGRDKPIFGTCTGCGARVALGDVHYCTKTTYYTIKYDEPVDTYQRIADALERIAVALENLVRQGGVR